jgi:hypothetical protein
MKIQNENRLIIIPNREQIPNIDEYSETVKSWPKLEVFLYSFSGHTRTNSEVMTEIQMGRNKIWDKVRVN